MHDNTNFQSRLIYGQTMKCFVSSTLFSLNILTQQSESIGQQGKSYLKASGIDYFTHAWYTYIVHGPRGVTVHPPPPPHMGPH